MASNRRNLKAYVRYDGSGRIIPGGPIFRSTKPKVGNWKEIPAYQCCNPSPQPPQALRLTFDNIENANLLVGDASDFNDWNTFFDLPTLGNPFTGVTISGTTVQLFGGSNIKVKPGLMYDYDYNTFLVSIQDNAGSITSVGGDAFSYCEGLTNVYLPECTIVYGYEDSPITNDYGGFGYCRNLVEVIIPKLETAGNYAFSDNKLTEINFPQLTTAGDNCFFFCTSLTTISLPQLTTAGGGCFLYCTSLTTISLPQLTTAGAYCFYDCPSLTTITLPQLTSAGNNCFDSCTSLTTISLPQLTTAGGGCFLYCTSLTTISLSELTTAGNACFSYCDSLTTINLPSCQNLGGTVGDDGVFEYISGNNITLTIPSALMTCNSGQPDGDIVYLQANNTVTINTV